MRHGESWHASDALLARFAALDGPVLPVPTRWSVEAHLERCPQCRATLTQVMTADAPEVLALVESARTELDARMAALPAARPRRRFARRLTGGVLLSRLLACVAVLVAAALLDVAAGARDDGAPSWLLLAAPVLPLLGVAASWGRALDPAHELVAATPAAGVRLLLWRTLVVLLVVVPASLLADMLTGTGDQAAWLLPCLALTAATLALGSAIDMSRAAATTAAAWALGVIAPALAMDETPAVLEPSWLPMWAALIVVAAGAIALRRNAYRHVLDA